MERHIRRRWKALLLLSVLASSLGPPQVYPACNSPNPLPIDIASLGKRYREPLPFSLLDKVATGFGFCGAYIAAEKNNRTNKFVGQ